MVAEHSIRAGRKKGHVGPNFTDEKSNSVGRNSDKVLRASTKSKSPRASSVSRSGPAAKAWHSRTRASRLAVKPPSPGPHPAAQTSVRENVRPNLFDLHLSLSNVLDLIEVVQDSLSYGEIAGPEHTTLDFAVRELKRVCEALDALDRAQRSPRDRS